MNVKLIKNNILKFDEKSFRIFLRFTPYWDLKRISECIRKKIDKDKVNLKRDCING